MKIGVQGHMGTFKVLTASGGGLKRVLLGPKNGQNGRECKKMIQTCRRDLIFGWLARQDMKLGVEGLMETFGVPMGSGGGAKMANLEAQKHIKWERMEKMKLLCRYVLFSGKWVGQNIRLGAKAHMGTIGVLRGGRGSHQRPNIVPK